MTVVEEETVDSTGMIVVGVSTRTKMDAIAMTVGVGTIAKVEGTETTVVGVGTREKNEQGEGTEMTMVGTMTEVEGSGTTEVEALEAPEVAVEAAPRTYQR